MADDIRLSVPFLGDEELDAVREVFASGWLAGQGPQSALLEERFAERCGVAHAIAVNNCTAGLHLALLALGVGPGDEVLVADYTFPATGHAVLFCGARPVFVDVRPDLATIDVDRIEERITPATKGVIAVDALGQPADYDDLEALCRARGLFLLEDAACSAGATYHGRATGSFGDIAAFSLHARKGITSGEGGVVTTDRADLAATVRKRACFGMESAYARSASNSLVVPVFDELGYNYKLSDVLAAIAVVQLDRLDHLLAHRRRLADRYAAALARVPGLAAAATVGDREPTWQTYAVVLDERVDRDAVAMALRENGIQCTIGTYASHVQPIYGVTDACPVSADLFRRHLALPMHNRLTEGDVDRVVESVTQVVAHQLERVA